MNIHIATRRMKSCIAISNGDRNEYLSLGIILIRRFVWIIKVNDGCSYKSNIITDHNATKKQNHVELL